MNSAQSLSDPADYVTPEEDCVTSSMDCSPRDSHLSDVTITITPDRLQPSGSLHKDDTATPTTLRYSVPQVSYYVGRYCLPSNVFFPCCESLFVCYVTCWIVDSSGYLFLTRLRARLGTGVRFDCRASPTQDWDRHLARSPCLRPGVHRVNATHAGPLQLLSGNLPRSSLPPHRRPAGRCYSVHLGVAGGRLLASVPPTRESRLDHLDPNVAVRQRAPRIQTHHPSPLHYSK